MLADPRSVALGNEPVRIDGEIVGRVTTGGYGYTVERSIAYAYLPPEHAEPGTAVEVEIFGEWVAGRGRDGAAFRSEGRADPRLAAAQPPQRSPDARQWIVPVAQLGQRAHRLRLDRLQVGDEREEHLGRRQHVAGGVVGAVDREPELARERGEAHRLRPRLAPAPSEARPPGRGCRSPGCGRGSRRRAAPGARTAPRASRRGRRAPVRRARPAARRASRSAAGRRPGPPCAARGCGWISGPGIRRGRTRRLAHTRDPGTAPVDRHRREGDDLVVGAVESGGLEVEHAERRQPPGRSRRSASASARTPRPRALRCSTRASSSATSAPRRRP